MSLTETLFNLREKYANVIPAEPAAVMEKHIEWLRHGGAADRILKPGVKAPAFTLKNQSGEDVSSADLLSHGPLVVSFTRGSWCPYCAAEVHALNEAYNDFKAAGIELVVLSPQSAGRTKQQATDDQLKFNLLVDVNNKVGEAFGVVYTFPDDLKGVYLDVFKLDIEKVNETAAWQLPIPARIVIDSNSIIRDVKADPDYRFRPEPSEVLDIVRKL